MRVETRCFKDGDGRLVMEGTCEARKAEAVAGGGAGSIETGVQDLRFSGSHIQAKIGNVWIDKIAVHALDE